MMHSAIVLGLSAFQMEVSAWSDENFGPPDRDPVRATLAMCEEVGELTRAVLKQSQGIRGTWQEWQTEIGKELGDVLITLMGVANRANIDFGVACAQRWDQVSSRTMESQKEKRLPE